MLIQGDARSLPLRDGSVHCCVTSPPYFGLRDYGVAGQLGLERTPDEYVANMVAVFREVWRVLRSDGTLWLNLGDSYAGSWGAQSRENPGPQCTSTLGGGSMLSARQIQAHPKGSHTGSMKNTPGLKPKDLIGIPWRVAFALQADGWYLRSDIIWAKPNPMPESVTDRPTKAHEYLFLLSKAERYYYDHEAIKEPSTYAGPNAPDKIASPYGQGFTRRARGHDRPHEGFDGKWDSMTKAEQGSNGRNRRSVWTVATRPFPEAHFATFPPQLIEPCILAGCPAGGTVLDPFTGSGTTALVAVQNNRNFAGVELNPEYIAIAKRRIATTQPNLFGAIA